MNNQKTIAIINKVLTDLKLIEKELDDWDLYDPAQTHWNNVSNIVWDLGQYLENTLEEINKEKDK